MVFPFKRKKNFLQKRREEVQSKFRKVQLWRRMQESQIGHFGPIPHAYGE
jgi:hypothetical protein